MDPAPTLAQRLARVIEVMHPADRGPYTAREIAEGTGLSAAYVNFLLRGVRGRRVSDRTLSALAKFFGVPKSYFDLDQDSERIEEQLASLQLLAALRREEVRSIALRLGDLTDADLGLLREFVDRLRPDQDDPAG
jgi:transcriptional regulator with XRE-family HTH domain